MIKDFEEGYLEIHYELRKQQWSNYFEEKIIIYLF